MTSHQGPGAVPAVLQPDGLPAPIGLYSHGSRVTAGTDLLFVAGQLAVGEDGQPVGQGDFEAQTRQVFANLRGVLAAAGLGPRNVAKFTTYVSAPEYVEGFYQAREKLFAENGWYPDGGYPPNTLLVVARLVRPEFMIEVEAVAAGPAGSAGEEEA
jgi:2-iminobutanoate/2-iminopropanoate deaminase